jgi:hypothetical protein
MDSDQKGLRGLTGDGLAGYELGAWTMSPFEGIQYPSNTTSAHPVR